MLLCHVSIMWLSIFDTTWYDVPLRLNLQNRFKWLCWLTHRWLSLFSSLSSLRINRALQLVHRVLTNSFEQAWPLSGLSADDLLFILIFLCLDVLIQLACKTGREWVIWLSLFTCLLRQLLLVGCVGFICVVGYRCVMHERCCKRIHQGRLVHGASLSSQILDPTTNIETINCRLVHDTLLKVVVSKGEIHVPVSKRLPSSFTLPGLFWEHLNVCLLFFFTPEASSESRAVWRLDRLEVW